MGCAKFFIDNIFPSLSISYCSYLPLLLVFYFGKSTLVKLCLVKNNAELGHSRAQDKCQDCCENNICQLACVLCSAVLCCTLLCSAVLCCALPWEFSQPEESRDSALAREETFPDIR